jgi:hypothetical protein
MLSVLLVLSVVLNGLLSGASLDQSIKQVPSRRRIGNRSYAVYTRGADLGAGLLWYILLPNLAVLCTLAAAVITVVTGSFKSPWGPAISIAAALSLAHGLATLGAAPKMLRSRRVSLDDEVSLDALFGSFERWQAIRAILQLLTFACSIWALIEAWP